MRILITGAGGFVAGHAGNEFLANGAEVFATGRFARRDASLPYPWKTADLALAGAWDELLAWANPDAILHLAAQSSPRDSWDSPRATFDGNLSPVLELVGALKRHKRPTRLLYVSSSDVYGFPSEDALPLTEGSAPAPSNPYAVSKLAAEECLRLYARHYKLDIVIARPFSHSGPGQDTRFVVPAFAREVAMVEAGLKKALTHGDLDTWRDFSDVRDVVRAYRMLIESGASGETYNICSGESVRIGDLLVALTRIAGIEAPTEADDLLLRPETRVCVRGSAEKLAATTGWARTIPLETTLADVLALAREAIQAGEREPAQ